jgi:hypothetical protein
MNIPMFVGVDEKFVNLAAIALVEDESTETESVAKLTTMTGDEIELVGTDAEIVFDKLDLFAAASNALLEQMQRAAGIQAASAGDATEGGE